MMEKLRIAVIGQSDFAAAVYKRVISDGHEVVGVFTLADDKVTGEENPVATIAKVDSICSF